MVMKDDGIMKSRKDRKSQGREVALIRCRTIHGLVNRPGVAGAVLQTPSSLSQSVSHPLVPIYSIHFYSQTIRALELKI